MNGLKSLFAIALLVVLGSGSHLAQAKHPDAETGIKPASPPESKPAAKSTPAEDASKADAKLPSIEFCQCTSRDSNSASTKKIEQALASPLHQTGVDYVDQPLQDVVTALSDEYGIPIQLNRTALEEAGIGTDSKITVTLHNISLRSALRLMLRTQQLTWVIRDEVLLVTTKEDAEKDLDTCVYNVQGLVDDADPKSVRALVDAIICCVATDTWAENGGGQAEVQPLPSGLFVVSQTAAIHEEVGALLDKIRKMREKVPLVKAGPRGYDPPLGRRSVDPSPANKKDSSQPKTANNGGGLL